MAKKVTAYIKLQVPAGQANPSPPVGPALGQHGVNIMEFCKGFNAQTQGVEPGAPVPVVITVFADKSFEFIIKTAPAAAQILAAAKNEITVSGILGKIPATLSSVLIPIFLK